MSLSDLARLTALLVRIGRFPAPLVTGDRIRESERRTPTGVPYDLFEPTKPPMGTVIAVHGVTLNGRRDRRLRHFARSLALGGVRCALPTLSGLADLQWLPSDIDELCCCLADVSSAPTDGAARQGRIGLIGFSYGGSYALLAAARPRPSERIGFVLTFGAYSSFLQVYDHGLAGRDAEPGSEAAWDDRIYLEAVLAWRHRFTLGLDPALSARIEELLRSFCQAPNVAGKRALYERHLKPLGLIGHDHRLQDRQALQALSPQGQLSTLTCPVGLFHDPDDNLVPAAQARALFAELRALPGGERHRMLVTSMLRHITLSGMLNPREISRLFSMLMPLIGHARR
jgi:pimeloyl-ACP methyl ester carboxylesterase